MKKCPHCGCNAFLNATYSYRLKCYFVFAKCDICGAQTRAFRDDNDPNNSNWQSSACNSAVDAWNMRSNDAHDDVAPQLAADCGEFPQITADDGTAETVS